MSWNDVISIAQDANNSGGRILLVGGSVRDHLLGLPKADYDLEVFGIPLKKLKIFCRKYGNISIVGASFSVLKIFLKDNSVIDVSIPRREKATGKTHKSFDIDADPYMSVEEAALRRDLTVNAISMDPLTNEIIDPYNGRNDLENKILRHVSSRFSEDPLRIMRVIRFTAQLGFDIAKETKQLCHVMISQDLLDNLPSERIEEEFKRFFVKGQPGSIMKALYLAEEIGVFKKLFPELQKLKSVPQDPRYHSEGDCLIHTFLTIDRSAFISQRDMVSDRSRYILCLAAMVHDLGKLQTTVIHPDGAISAYGHDKAGVRYAIDVISRITRTKDISDRVIALVKTHMRPLYLASETKISDAAIRRLAKAVEPSTLVDLAMLVEADTMATYHDDNYPKINAAQFLKERSAALGVNKKPPEPLLKGRDLIEMAENGELPSKYKKGGRHYKDILETVYEAQLDGNITSLQQAKNFAGKLINH